MRHYAPYDRTKQSDYAGKKKERKERTSTEWDIRIDTTNGLVGTIIDTLKNGGPAINYCLVSGVEQPDNADITWGSRELHVHIALVSEYPLRRDQALALCRGLMKSGEEYAVPRNRKFTYAGWYMHHTKIDYKLVTEPAVRYEFGDLPEDATDEETKTKVKAMFKKFGGGETSHEAANAIKFLKWLT